MTKVAVKVDNSKSYQTISGFGGCMTTWVAQSDYLDETWYDTLVYDLGASIVRIPLAASLEPVNNDSDPDHFEEKGFRPEVMGPRLAFAEEFVKRGVKNVFGSLWSPPRWQKTNRNTFHGGSLRPDMRKEFAEYISAWVKLAKEKYNMDFLAVGLQNEAYFVEPYHSCIYNPIQARETLRAVNRKLVKEGLAAKVMMPEDLGFANRILWYIRPMLSDPETNSIQGIIGVHGSGNRDGIDNWRRMRDAIAENGSPLWMTETGGGRRDWNGCLALAKEMHNALAGGNLAAWCMWQFTQVYARGVKKPGYWANKHFYKYIRPGMVRIEASPEEGDVVISAYSSQDGKAMTCVLLNTGNEEAEVEITLPANAPQSFRVFVSDEIRKFEDMGVVSSKGKILLKMGPSSTATLAGGDFSELMPDETSRGKHGLPAMTRYVPVGKQLLFEAAGAGDAEGIRKLIAEGHYVDERHISDETPLHNAAYASNPEAIKALVEAGADLEARDDNQMTPLLLAANRMQTGQVKAYIECGADVHARDYMGWTALHYAANTSEIEMVEALLKAGGNPCAAAKDGWTPLHAAVSTPYSGSTNVAKRLLDAGADVKAVSADGWTPLHAAAANCNTVWNVPRETAGDKIRLLIAAGAEVNAADRNGNTPLHWAAWMGHSMCNEQYDAETTVYTYGVKALLEAGAEVNAVNADGKTPLHLACMEGHDAIAEALLQAGAALDARDNEGNTALDYAIKCGHPRIAAILRGQSTAAESSDANVKAEAVKGTGKYGAELIKAAREGNIQRINELLKDGADPNAMNTTRNTPLHYAAELGYEEIVDILLAAGAFKGSINSDGYTPADLAERNGRRKLAEKLRMQ